MNKNKKSNKKIIIPIVIGVLVLLVFGIGFLARSKAPNLEKENVKNEEETQEETTNIEQETVDTKEETEKETEEETEETQETEETDEQENEKDTMEEQKEVIELLDYKNELIGIGFNYNTDMYVKENTTNIFNTLKDSSDEKENFNIFKDTVIKEIDFVHIKDSEDVININLTLLPFELEIVEKEKNKEEVEEKEIDLSLIIDEDFISRYDNEIKKELEEKEITLDFFEPSKKIVNESGRIGIYSNKQVVVSDELEEQHKIQTQTILVPINKNAILITLVSDETPTEYNKEQLIKEIFNSLEILEKGRIENGENKTE